MDESTETSDITVKEDASDRWRVIESRDTKQTNQERYCVK